MKQVIENRTPLQRLLWLGGMAKAAGGKLSEFTASGNPCVFETDVARPLKRLSLSLLPRQSGTGDPSPSNIRPLLPWGEAGTWHGGKNLLPTPKWGASGDKLLDLGGDCFFDALTFSFTANGTSVAYNSSAVVDLRESDGTHHYITLAMCKDSNGQVFPANAQTSGRYSLKVTGVKFRYIYTWYVSNIYSQFNGNNVTEWQLEVGEQASPYTPYSPITPHPVNVGKNLGNFVDGYGIAVNGTVVKSATRCATVEPIPINQTESYVISGQGTGKGFIYSVWNGETLVRRLASQNSGTVLDVSGGTHLYVCMYENATVEDNKPQVEIGSIPSPYQPYLPPVYGCELDLTTWEVWGTWASFSAKWKDGKSPSVRGDNTRKLFSLPNIFVRASGSVTAYCNVAKWVWDYEVDSIHFYLNRGASYVFLPNDTDGETDILIVGKLETPVLLATLTAQQVSALVGVNTVWSDADNVDVTYLKKG